MKDKFQYPAEGDTCRCQRCGKQAEKLAYTPAGYMKDIDSSWMCPDCYREYSVLQLEHRLKMVKWALLIRSTPAE